MSWDFSTDPEFEQRLRWVRDFMDDVVYPLESLDLDLATFDRLAASHIEEVRERGLWATHLDPALGGTGEGQVRHALINEIVGRSHLGPQFFGTGAPDSGNMELLGMAASDAQRERWFDPLVGGRIRSAVCMTEPGAGSDPTKIETRLDPDGEGWLLSGTKWFATNASAADLLVVMAVSDQDAAPRNRATIALVAADAEGVEVVRDIGSMEDPTPLPGQLENHCEVIFRDVRVESDQILGSHGEGFSLMQKRLAPARVHHCSRWIGQAQRALDMLCERAAYREVLGGTLAAKQTVQNWIAESTAELQAFRLMTLQAAWKIDTFGSREARVDIGLLKFFGAKVLNDIIDRALQLHGSLGFSSDLPLEQMLRRARAARIYDGPDEVHREHVSRLVMRGYEPPADGVPTEHIPTRRAAARRLFLTNVDD